MHHEWVKVVALIIIWAIALVVAGYMKVARKNAMRGRMQLYAINQKLDALIKHAGITFDPNKDVPASVMEAINNGEKIQAIKLYRELTQKSLAESKEFIEAILRNN